MNRLAFILSLLVLFSGLACCHYTKPDGMAHHTRQAQEHGWPPPSNTTLLMGVIAVASGGIGCGWFAAGGRKRANIET